MPVVQGGGVAYDAGAALREGFKNLSGSLQNLAVIKQEERKHQLNVLNQAVSLVKFSQEASGLPMQAFLGSPLAKEPLSAMFQAYSAASGRQMTGDQAQQMVNMIQEYDKDRANLSKLTFAQFALSRPDEVKKGSSSTQPLPAQPQNGTPEGAQTTPQTQAPAQMPEQGTVQTQVPEQAQVPPVAAPTMAPPIAPVPTVGQPGAQTMQVAQPAPAQVAKPMETFSQQKQSLAAGLRDYVASKGIVVPEKVGKLQPAGNDDDFIAWASSYRPSGGSPLLMSFFENTTLAKKMQPGTGIKIYNDSFGSKVTEGMRQQLQTASGMAPATSSGVLAWMLANGATIQDITKMLFPSMPDASGDTGYQDFQQKMLASGVRVAGGPTDTMTPDVGHQFGAQGGLITQPSNTEVMRDTTFASALGVPGDVAVAIVQKFPAVWAAYKTQGAQAAAQFYRQIQAQLAKQPGLYANAGADPSGIMGAAQYYSDQAQGAKPGTGVPSFPITAGGVTSGTQPASTTVTTTSGKPVAITPEVAAKAKTANALVVPSSMNINYTGPKAAEHDLQLMRDPVTAGNIVDKLRASLGMPTKSFKAKSEAHLAAVQAGNWINTTWNLLTPQERINVIDRVKKDITETSPEIGYFSYGKEWSDTKLTQDYYEAQKVRATADAMGAQATVQAAGIKEAFTFLTNYGDQATKLVSDAISATISKGGDVNKVNSLFVEGSALTQALKTLRENTQAFLKASGFDVILQGFSMEAIKGWFGGIKGYAPAGTTGAAQQAAKPDAETQAVVNDIMGTK